MTSMIDSREKGKPIPYGPKFEASLDRFEVDATGDMDTAISLRMEISTRTLRRINSEITYAYVHCPYCDWSKCEERYVCGLALEDHIYWRHGTKLPSDHPLHRRTQTQRAIDWLFESTDL